MDDIRELSQRLARLEERNRRTRSLLMGLLLVSASALILMGQTAASPRNPLQQGRPETNDPKPVAADGKIRAEAFILVDSTGRERASLVADGGGSVFLVMFDKDGKPRADLQVNNYGPSLNFYDPDARTRVALGSTTLVASHVSNKGVIEKNTPSSIVMFDAGGQLLWRTP